ncbi:hypothetical protein IHE45_15G033300 [Dioscorea alata]|uniref:Uncharacterized protein n=1 Tax=Dioscorea alata TaxID=55571 RepID=A0ACB7UKK1_DIOAL|nr:hypothetical protein IHE45_15G033300 [Dioscorea alata]
MASRSPSPTPSKTPDTSIRKSGSFHNLSKHSISPDVHQRSSGLKAGTPLRSLHASLELKENERDHHSLRQGKVKSPAMASLKNFMAPTISASSKVVAASPRRRILGDRNEMVSVSDSPKSETRMMDLEIKKSSEDVVVPKFPISPVCDSLPPYDPLTNYLSPRPQFLRYKPNHRVEKCYLKKDVAFFDEPEGDGISDDSFLSDCFTDITEEMQSSDLQKSSQEEEEEEDEEEEVQVETKPQIVHIQTTQSTSRSKLVPFLLVLVMACLCIPLSDSPLVVSPSSVLKEGSSAKVEIREYLTDIAAFAKLNLEGLSDRMSHWSVNTMSYLATMPWLQKDGDFGVFRLPNMSTTASDEDVAIDFSFSETRPNQEHWNVELETEQFLIEDVEELEEEVEELENGGFLGPEPEVKEVEETDEVNESEMGIVALHDVLENDHEAPTVEEVAKEDYTSVASDMEGKTKENPLSIHPVNGELGIVENQEDTDELNSIVEILPVAGFDGKQSIKAAKEDSKAAASETEGKTEESLLGIHPVSDELGMMENQTDTHELNSTVEMLPVAGFDGKHSTLKLKEIMNHGARIFIAVIAVIGAIVVLYLKRRKSSADGNHSLNDKYGNVTQKFTEEVEMAGYSGSSSDGSSLNNKTSFDRQRARRAKLEDSLGHERSLRRDSSASSSISYGSFTTYERLSAKKVKNFIDFSCCD